MSIISDTCAGVEIGRQASLRWMCRKVWRFKSSPAHKNKKSSDFLGSFFVRGLEQERGRENESFPVVEAGALLRWNRKGPKRRNGVTSSEIPLPRTK